MATPTARNRIAHDVGIPVRSLRVATPGLVAPATPSPLSDFALQASEAAPSPYLLTIGTPADASASGAQLPIVTVSAQAPTPLEATRLTAAAVSGIEATAPPPAGFGNHDQPITAEQITPIRAGAVVTGSPRRTAAMAAVFVLGLWCCAALGVSALVRRLRRRAPVGAPAV